MTGIRIVADDLTGALDSAAPFAMRSDRFVAGWFDGPPPDGTHAAYDIAARDVTAGIAVERCAGIARRWWRSYDGLAFLKVDSVWRGHPAAMIGAAMRVGGFERAIVAPAFPAHGRVTREGKHFIDREGDAATLTVDLVADLRSAGLDAGRVSERVIVGDAQAQGDLETLVDSRPPGERTLWCGSGGLAAALARRLGPPLRPPLPLMPMREGNLVVIAGSDHAATRAQAAALAAARDVARWRIDLATQSIVERPRASSSQVILVQVEGPSGLERAEANRRLARLLRVVAETLPLPGSVLVAGGESLRAVCEGAGATTLCVEGEWMPGFPQSICNDGRWRGVRMLSKSGSFGTADQWIDVAARLVPSEEARMRRNRCPA